MTATRIQTIHGTALSDETRVVAGCLVRRFNICTTRTWVYAVYEPTELAGHDDDAHSTVTTFEGHVGRLSDGRSTNWWGRLGTRGLPSDINALPVGEARSNAVAAYHDKQYALAYRLILAAFPEAADGRRDMGEIEIRAEVA
ncbi:MAG: hypothetical protein ACM3S5_18835 [Rhodospirillales bacterium]